MAELKTTPTKVSVEAYLNTLDESKKSDAKSLLQIMKVISQEKPVMWGSSIIGFGNKRYKYESGREIDYFLIGFSVRKKAITLYLSVQLNMEEYPLLGKHEKGVGCLYIKQLNDINIDVLSEMISRSVESARNHK